ncbi:MAG: hypothetical protein ACRENL_12430 [Candidatus Dormibacteria bacterium]
MPGRGRCGPCLPLRGEEIARRGAALGVLPLPITAAAIILATQGESGPARERLQEAHRLLDGRDESIREIRYGHGWSVVAVIDRDYAGAVEAIRRLDVVAETRGERWLHSFAPDHVNALVSAGDIEAARDHGERMLVGLTDAGIDYAATALRAALARVEAADGNVTAATEFALQAAEEAETIDGTFLPAMVRSYAGEALLAVGRRALAYELLVGADARRATIGVAWRAAEVKALLGTAG